VGLSSIFLDVLNRDSFTVDVATVVGRPRRRWEDNIKMDLRAVGLGSGGIDWIDLAQDRDR
jgi:hypothetical protein